MPNPFALLTLWRRRRAFRRALGVMLDSAPHLISDIGLTEADARAEAARPFWRG
jgi:uncharacterized protein YjiS (DUF1127 family)